MLIRVIFENKRTGLLDASRLGKHIMNGNILAFRRLDGWARVGNDPVRGFGGCYSGPDRRTASTHFCATCP